jgi:hypothetical protein
LFIVNTTLCKEEVPAGKDDPTRVVDDIDFIEHVEAPKGGIIHSICKLK